jgi:hypothetical protein
MKKMFQSHLSRTLFQRPRAYILCQWGSPLQAPGLPDGFFSDQKSQFGYILEDLGMENVVIYSGHLEYFTTIGHILWAFGNFLVIWYIFPRCSILKIWQPRQELTSLQRKSRTTVIIFKDFPFVNISEFSRFYFAKIWSVASMPVRVGIKSHHRNLKSGSGK